MKLRNKKQSLIIDIGSAWVSGVLLSSPNDLAEFSRMKKVPIGAGTKETREALGPRMLEALKQLLEDYQDHTGNVRVVITSPWHDSKVRIVSSISKKPVAITEKTIEAAVQKYQDEKPPKQGNVDVEAVAMQVKVDGYTTVAQRPVKGSSLKINLYESEMKKDLHNKVQEVVGKVFPNARISFNTFPLVSGVSLREITSEDSFVYVDVGGEVTDLGIVHGDGLHFLASLPIGYLSIIREIGGDKIGDTSSRLALMIRNELSIDEEAALMPQFEEAFNTWLHQFEETLKAASEKVPIPRTVFMMSEKDPLQWMKKGLDKKGTLGLFTTPVLPNMVQNLIIPGEDATYDVFLALSAIFFHKGEDEVVGEDKPSRMVYSRQ